MRISDWSSDVCSSDLGLLIDYRGILKALDTALTEYQDLAERTQGGFDLNDIDELYADVSTEYKRLPNLHADLWTIFKPVKNRADIEQYRQLRVPQTCESEDGTPIDHNQTIREDRSEERREGREGVGTCRVRWSP